VICEECKEMQYFSNSRTREWGIKERRSRLSGELRRIKNLAGFLSRRVTARNPVRSRDPLSLNVSNQLEHPRLYLFTSSTAFSMNLLHINTKMIWLALAYTFLRGLLFDGCSIHTIRFQNPYCFASFGTKIHACIWGELSHRLMGQRTFADLYG